MKPLSLIVLCSLLLSGCASYAGRGLVAGESNVADITGVMGTPALQWQAADGSRRLAYPRGPMGVHTFMAQVGADGKLQRIDNVLVPEQFARITPGMRQDEVLRLLGPPQPAWTVYFAARDELVWEWRYCDDWNQLARFDVLFDGSSELVRSTMTLRDDQLGRCGRDGGCWCSR